MFKIMKMDPQLVYSIYFQSFYIYFKKSTDGINFHYKGIISFCPFDKKIYTKKILLHIAIFFNKIE